MIAFEDITKSQLWELRQEVIVNSVFLHDYENSFGYDKACVCSFFDGYYNFLWELAEEEFNSPTHANAMSFDNEDTLWSWYNCHEDFSWFK